MPTCGNITTGYTRSCENIASGIKNIWVANYTDAATWAANASGEITGGTSAPTFYKYEVREGTCSLSEELVVNAQYGAKNVRQNLELVFIGQGSSQRERVNDLLGARLACGVETEEGIYILLGETKALEVNAGAGSAGVQAGEENSIRLTLSALSNEFAPVVATSYATTIFTA